MTVSLSPSLPIPPSHDFCFLFPSPLLQVEREKEQKRGMHFPSLSLGKSNDSYNQFGQQTF